MFNLDGRVAAVFVGIGAGAAGYAAVPLFLYLEGNAFSSLAAIAISVVGLGYLLGRSLDSVDRLSMSVALLPLLLSLLLGAAFYHAQSGWVWSASALIILACVSPIAWDARHRAQPPGLQVPDVARIDDSHPSTVDGPVIDFGQLDERVEHPHYQRFPDYHCARAILEPLLTGRSAHLALHGPGGCGLTSTARALADDVAEVLQRGGRELIYMTGECSHASGEPIPYGPFQKALARHFEIERLATPQSQLAGIDDALGDVFQSVIPFAGILFPDAGGLASSGSSGEEIVPSITWMLRRLAKTGPIVLLIDDAQWIDEPSKGLLQHLLQEFPHGGPEPIAVIVTSHNMEVLQTLGFAPDQRVELSFPTSEQQVQLLTEGVGLAETTAEQIVNRIGATAVSQGGLFWLLQIVANLARGGVLVRTADGVALRDSKWPDDVFIPDEMRDVLASQLEEFSGYRTIIECAACACEAREFLAQVVAEALGMSRLTLLADLDHLDRQTSILYDVRNRDDVFAFQSAIMLDLVRDELKIVTAGPNADVPQIIREHHARLAACLEKSLVNSSHRLYAVANLYYAAGARHADRGTKYCLKAAHAAAAVLDFESAERYLGAQASAPQSAAQRPRLTLHAWKSNAARHM